MLYPQTFWRDHVTSRENDYQHVVNGDGTIKHVPVPGTIQQQGTPQNQPNFDNIEFGVQDAYIAIQILIAYLLQKGRDMDVVRLDAINEVKTITLTNSLKFPLNNSAQSVVLTTVRATLNYDVSCEVTAYTGNVGEVIVSEKQLNGFKVEFTGSATSVTIKIKIQGGILS